MRNTLLAITLTFIIILVGCSNESPSVNARKNIELIASQNIVKLPESIQHLHWTFADTLAKVAEEEHPDSAMAIFRELYRRKNEVSRIEGEKAMDQMLAINEFALESCDSGAIYIPNGDNDFYPALYLQKVRGVRPDILILHNSLVLLPSFREFYANEPRVLALFKRDEWMDGPTDSLDPVHWITWRKLDKGDEAPAVHVTLMCNFGIPINCYYQQGMTFKIAPSIDTLEWTALNAKLLKEKFPTEAFTEGWETEIVNRGWNLNSFPLAGNCVMNLMNYEKAEEAANLYVELTPIFAGLHRWWMFGLSVAEDLPIEKDFFIDGISEYFNELETEVSGFDSLLMAQFKDFVSE